MQALKHSVAFEWSALYSPKQFKNCLVIFITGIILEDSLHHSYKSLEKERESGGAVSLFKEHQKQRGRVIKKDYALDSLVTRYVGQKLLN